MFAAAYFGMLRIGEVAESEHVIKAENVHIGENKKKILFILRSSKTHWADSKPQMRKITSKAIEERNYKRQSCLCPFKLLKRYLSCRPAAKNDSEQFFVFADNSPVKTAQVRQILKTLLSRIGLDANLYNFHSLRGWGEPASS